MKVILIDDREFNAPIYGPNLKVAARAETAVHRAADAHAKKLAVTFRYAFAKGRAALRKALKASSEPEEAVVEAMRQALDEVLPKTLLKIAVAGGGAGLEILKQQLRTAEDFRTAKDTAKKIGAFNMVFDRAHPAVVKWAKKHAAELIDDVTKTSQKRIRRAIVDLVEEGDWNEAMDVILRAVGDEDRAERIAHHEVMMAASEGQRLAWGQAVENELLTGTEQRVWIVTPDDKLCPICEELEDKTAGLDEEYPGGYEGPPAHVSCRCTEGIV